MKKILTILIILSVICLNGFSQSETYGKTLNLGLGIGGYSGYYGYLGRSLPVFSMNYELDVTQNFTLAPFISIYAYSDNYYWGNNNTPYRNYRYREVVIPLGVKGTYYFDELLAATSRWDFYLAGSLGVAIVKSNWEDGYNGDRDQFNGGSSLFLDIHIGAEYHFTNRLGGFLDLSSGVSTIGIAIH